MTRVTRFAARDPGPAARLSGFMAHLRAHGFRLGVSETGTALAAMIHVAPTDPVQIRLALRAVCTGSADEAQRFDALFDAFWLNDGSVRQKVMPGAGGEGVKHARSTIEDRTRESQGTGRSHAPDSDDGGMTAAEGTGRLIAATVHNLMKKDLRELVAAEDIRAAEIIARRLGQAIRDRRSRRRRAARQTGMIDLRRTLRFSLSTGGEPLRLAHRTTPDRPVRIAALCDVSGSMVPYARPFLAFLCGLLRADPDGDAYLFHTRLVRISDALRDEDPLRVLNRITLLAEGFGGGSKIGANIDAYARTYARRFVNGRTVVLILSDGYDSDGPELLDAGLARLRSRGCRIVWLNPLKGWRGYAPVARGMAAALPHLDLFAAAATLDDLAALEPEFARI
jgi:uncharacterized protein with von Willebrand factor type A (vWA) domain